jgi:hypothetical protein
MTHCQCCATPSDLLSASEMVGGWCALCRRVYPRCFEAAQKPTRGRRGAPWTHPERQRARDLYASGLTSRQVAETMLRPVQSVRTVLWKRQVRRKIQEQP